MPTVTLNQTYHFFEEVLYYLKELYDGPVQNWRIDEDRLKKENNKKKAKFNGPGYVMDYYSMNAYNAVHLDKIGVNYMPDIGIYEFQFKDYPFKVTIDGYKSAHQDEDSTAYFSKQRQVIIECEDMDTITEFIMEGIQFQFGKALDKNVVKWHTYPGGGAMNGPADLDWDSKPIPETTLADIYLPREKKDNLVKDIQEFLLPETLEWYQRKKMPHHRIYLFTEPDNEDEESDPDTPPVVTQMHRGAYYRQVRVSGNKPSKTHYSNNANTMNQLLEAVATEFKLDIYVGAGSFDVKPKEKSMWVIPSNLLTAYTIGQIEQYEGIIIITALSMRDIEDNPVFDKSYIDAVVEFGPMDEENIMDLTRFFYDELQNEESNELLTTFATQLVVCDVSASDLKRYLHRFRHYNGPETLEKIKEAFMKMKEIKDQQHHAITAAMSSSKSKTGAMPLQMNAGFMGSEYPDYASNGYGYDEAAYGGM